MVMNAFQNVAVITMSLGLVISNLELFLPATVGSANQMNKLSLVEMQIPENI